jgi:hypothetical protein
MSEQQSLNGDGTITIKTSSWNRVVRERDEARNKMADALQEVDLRTLDFERMIQERDEAREESEQQARLLGISAEREYALRGKIFELERKILQLEAK